MTDMKYRCKKCGAEFELKRDESRIKCPSCGERFNVEPIRVEAKI